MGEALGSPADSRCSAEGFSEMFDSVIEHYESTGNADAPMARLATRLRDSIAEFDQEDTTQANDNLHVSSGD